MQTHAQGLTVCGWISSYLKYVTTDFYFQGSWSHLEIFRQEHEAVLESTRSAMMKKEESHVQNHVTTKTI